MKKYIILSICILVLAVGWMSVFWFGLHSSIFRGASEGESITEVFQKVPNGKSVSRAPQTNALSAEQILNYSYNATDGGLQIDLVNNARALTPQNNSLSPAQVFNSIYNSTDGALQVACDNCGGGSVEGFHNVTGFYLQPTSTDRTDFVGIYDADGGIPILNIDTINERVGIGVDAPLSQLHIVQSEDGELRLDDNDPGTTAGGYEIQFRRERSDGAITNSEDLGSIVFYGAYSDNSYIEGARIYVENTGGSWIGGATRKASIKFKTQNGGTYNESMQLDEAGNLTVLGGGTFGNYTADPCSLLSEGAIWYNDTSDIPCYCDASSNDLKFSDNAACF